ncbi:alpha/beta hydrolase [Formosa haliotis]|uniref:alpha/beta hydrolase n=1 Tax=Formosa haliotis TaxID=1555194 RepID=UPI0013565813|nr:alpha/beta hydrolase [Formosa haliotis]
MISTADTSYTITSAYKKVLKKHPYISIAKADTKQVKAHLNIPYKIIGKDNLQLDAFIHDSASLKPAIILVHGGAWKSGSKELLNPLAEQLAAYGFNSFSINYRLAPQYKFPDAIFDINDALRYIVKHADEFKINPNKLILLGCSSGAQLASLVATTSQSTTFQKQLVHLKALINIDGILAFSHPKSEESTSAANWIGATENDNPELWKQASPLTYVDETCPPTLFIASDFGRFQAGRDEMISILKQHTIPYQVKIIHDAPHTFWLFNPWFDEVTHIIIDFLNVILN